MARRSTKPRSGHTILVVDDQDDTLSAVRALLERAGHDVLTADSGPQALDILKKADVHLLVVDYFMPRMTGGDLVREIRTFDPYVQIVLQTGYAGEKPPRAMLAELDIQGYHDKADDPERLLLWVDVGLRTYRLLRTLREREQLQSELVANCSHEFRTPLHIITGYAELLLSDELAALPEPLVKPVRAIESASRNLTDLVVDFLGFTKLETGAEIVDVGTVRVPELVREMGRLAELLLEEKPVTFAVELLDAPATVATDGGKLRTIVRNLVVNATKFTAAGTVTLRIVRRGDTLRIEVKDTGVGIRPDDQTIIFEPFRQLDGSSTRTHGGVGLGLALGRKLARLLGGDLVVASEPGRGSTFSLVLPAERVGLASAPRPGDPAPAPAGG